MINIHHRKDTGEIVSYQEGSLTTPDNEIPPFCDVLRVPSGTNILGYLVKGQSLLPIPKNLIGAQRAAALAKKAAQSPEGCFVEIGVYQGGSALYLNSVAKQQGRRLHLFDTFCGIVNDKGQLDCSETNEESVRNLLPEAVFHVGIFPDTITEEVQDIAFIHSDYLNMYTSLKTIKEHLWERMVSGCRVYFDDPHKTGYPDNPEGEVPEACYDPEVQMMYVVKE